MIKRGLIPFIFVCSLVIGLSNLCHGEFADSHGHYQNTNFLGSGNDSPETVFDTKQIFDNNPLFWDDQEESGGSTTSTHSVNKAATTLGVGATTAGVRTRQTFMWHNYQPAKIQHVIITGILIASGGGTGITVHAGQMDDNNGIGFFYDEGTVKTLIRTKTSGSVVNNTEAQSAWDDPLNGSGRSGIEIDWTKNQVMGFSYGWLGGDTVIFWVKIDGVVWIINVVENANTTNVSYMSTPNLPLRWRIENDGTGVASTTEQHCATVISEGESRDIGVKQYLSTSGTHIDLATENVVYAIHGIKLKAANLGASIKIEDISIATNTANGHFEWFLVFNPTVTGTFVYGDRANSSVQTASSAGDGATVTFSEQNVVTGGIVLAGGGAAKGGGGDRGINNARRIGSLIDGTPDTIVLCCRPIMAATAIDIEATITYRELN